MSREAEVLEMPTHASTSVTQARRVAQGRSAVERYVERLENATERLKTGPEAVELYGALAELREGMIENAPDQARELYEKAIESFQLSHAANMGIRRLNRSEGNFEDAIASLEAEMATSTHKRDLQIELVRTWLYGVHDAEKAITILETMEKADSEASTLIPENELPFDAEIFLLWEDALMATGAWDRYEGKLLQALRQQKSVGPMTQHLEERLWLMYRYIMPDEEQAEVLCKHLMSMQPLDDELVEDALLRAQVENKPDALVNILKQAIERLNGSPRESYYRALLADVAQFDFDDREQAMEVLDGGKSDSSLVLLHQQIGLLSDCGRADILLDPLAKSLEFIYTPQLKAEQLYRIACILRDDMERDDAAIDVLQEANEICPTHEPTIEALASYYTESGEWEHLAQLYEYEISYATEHQIPEYTPEVMFSLHARLAFLYENQLHFALNAFNHYQAMLTYRADDIAALKGASRMSQTVGNWTELLQLYAAAEGRTQDTHEHVYLLDRIAQIADIYLNDADTACTALEALRAITPHHDTTTSSLARLYVKLKKWDALIALTDEEIETSTNPEYKVTLLCRNAEVSEAELSNIPQAVLYYEKARTTQPTSRAACAALERLYTHQKSWEKLADLLKSEASLTSDARLKCAFLRRLADVLDLHLDFEDEAIETFESALKYNPLDAISRHYLLNYYRHCGRWEDVLRILDIEINAGGTLGAPWLTWFWKGRILLYRVRDELRALDAFEKAFELNPDEMTVLQTWLSLGLRLGKMENALERLEAAREKVKNDAIKLEIEHAIADLTLRTTHDPRSIEAMIVPFENSSRVKGRGVRFLSTMLVAVNSSNGRWISRLNLALQPRQPKELQRHAIEAAVLLDMPEEIRDRSLEVLCQIQDLDLARRLWTSLSPCRRPSFHKIQGDILKHPSREAQDLRRWVSISKLLAGEIEDPTDGLLPDNRDESLSYRPDLELLAAYFERFENWNKLLEVLNVQEETLNELETIHITLQKAWVLSKIRKPAEALASVRKACTQCQYTNPMRLSLYDYLVRENDWDFLSEQIRQHLMHTENSQEKASLWLRLAEIYKTGLRNLEESLRCLNNAYQEDSTRGEILCEISETAEKIDELEIARRSLDDYIRYHKPSLEEQLALEPRLLKLHFEYPDGDTDRMLKYFEHLVNKTGRSRACLIILARAHAKAGDPNIAAEILLQTVSLPIAEDDLELWTILGDLYLDRLGEQQKGERIFWELFHAYPEMTDVFNRLNALYKEPAERRIMVANLRNAVTTSPVISKNPALVRKYLGFAARILSNELGAWKESQELYTLAISADTEPAADLIRDRAYARCRIPGEATSAYREFCDLLVHDPFQPDIYRAAFDICRRNGANDRERILRQLAAVFVPEAGFYDKKQVAESRPKMMGSRHLEDEYLMKYLVHPDIRPVLILLHEAMPILNNTLHDLVPKRTSLGGERIRNVELMTLFQTCASAFGMSDLKGCWGHEVSPVPVVMDDPSCFWISQESWETMTPEIRRHWSGYASGLLWTNISRMIWFDPGEVWQLLDGIYYLVTGRGIAGRNAYTIEASERVNSMLQRGIRRDVARLIDEIGPENIPPAVSKKWVDGLYATADRAGLMYSGNLLSSIPALLEAEGWNPAKMSPEYLAARLKLSKRIPRLIEYALSDDYLQLRYLAGLAVKPSTIHG